ncbi:hypothetical protein E5D57_012158 [Metarhizium anisopliae]|nr:hypothetical protein E5D57_012158 [Metarhizium anisopliae]
MPSFRTIFLAVAVSFSAVANADYTIDPDSVPIATRNACKSDCQQKHPCGAQDPVRPNATKTAGASATSTGGSNTIYTNAPGGGSDNGKKGAGVALEVGRTYGLAIVLTSLFAGFALL